MRITIHRGSSEIGGSCIEIESNSSRIVLDLGMPLVDSSGNKFDMEQYTGLQGPELVKCGVLPNVQGIYRWDNDNPLIDGLFLSHSHMDHCGFSHYVHPQLSVYLGKASYQLIGVNSVFTPFEGIAGSSGILENRRPLKCGDFKITPFMVDHSAFEAFSFLVEAQGKRLFYTGDFRDHGRKPKSLQLILDKLSRINIDALLLEGTMLGRLKENELTEKDIEEKLVSILIGGKGPFFVCVSAHNIDRLVSLYRAALRTDSLFVIDIYTAHILDTLKNFARLPHPSPAYKQLKVFYPYYLSRRLAEQDRQDILYRYKNFKISRSEIEKHAKNTIMMVRPSLRFDLEKMNIPSNATFIYSIWKGYRVEKEMKNLMAFVRKNKMNVHYIHCSGHAPPQILKKMINTLKPNVVIPIHTFHPEKYFNLSKNIRILEDREVFHL